MDASATGWNESKCPGEGGCDLEGDGVDSAVCHAKLLGQAEGGAQVGSIEGCPSHYGLISVQMPALPTTPH